MITRQVVAETEARDPSLLKQAEDAIADFETAITPGIWALLDKATLVAQMRDRVRNPYKINQGGQPFCGPASVLFELVRKHPVRYVEICRNLYQLGGFHSASQFITASEKLRHATFGNLRMEQADWMILSTLREMENLLFPVEPNAPDLIRNLAGMTKSWEMRGWVHEILGYKTVDYAYTFLNNDLQAMTKAADVLRQGGVAFALVTADGMLNDKPPIIPVPTHWIGLVGNLSIPKDSVNFDVYTWSKKIRLQMDHGSFKKYLWAVVTGLP